MLSKKENLLQTIHGGSPDRFVNQYEYMALVFEPVTIGGFGDVQPGYITKNGWGVTINFPEGAPGPIPVHNEEVTVLKDVTKWREIVKAPRTEYSDEEWQPFLAPLEGVDRNDIFVAPFVAPGIFEKLHYLMGMEETMINFYEEPEAMHELIDFLTEWELAGAKEICAHLHPDALFHHDDWGSQTASILSPEMFNEFFTAPYKKIYSFWKANGVELVVHHSDSYAANLVPYMIEMGVDIWQGAVSNNNLPALIKQYGGQISFQGGMDNGKIDHKNWDKEEISLIVEDMCRSCGKHYFIPSATMGGDYSTYPGVYDTVSAEIDRMSSIMFECAVASNT